MVGNRILLVVISVLVTAPTAGAHGQAPDTPESLLSALVGSWYFEERAIGPDASYSSAGTRTFRQMAPDRLQWIDELQTGRTLRGALRFDADRSVFEYSFGSASGDSCMVEGLMVGDGRVHFSRAGTCAGLVMESDLVLVSNRLHTYSRSDGAFVAIYTRQGERR